MNNEPVAWRKLLDTGNYMYFENYFGNSEPLYTHPAKTLTDEEIEQIANIELKYQIESSYASGVYDFARAILRKAQEK